MLKRSLTIVLLLLPFIRTNAQNIGVGQWKSHLSQNDPVDLFLTEDRMYAWTNYALCRYDIEANETKALSKIDGYTEVGVQYADYHPAQKTIVIAYQNSNIDLQLSDGSIFNVPDLVNASVNGSKEIHKISFYEDYAFFSCGFGILVYNVARKESSADYKSDVIRNVYSTQVYKNEIYAATSDGLYKAPLPSGGISVDASQWSKVADGNFHDMVQASGNLYIWQDSLILRYDGNQFTNMLSNKAFRKIKAFEDEVYLTTDSGVYMLTQNPVSFYPLEGSKSSLKKDDMWYYASGGYGVIRKHSNGLLDFLSPGGPYADGTGKMVSKGHTIYIAGGTMKSDGAVTYSYNGYYTYTEGEWASSQIDGIPYIDTMYDIHAMAIDPTSGDLWAAALEQGIVRVRGKSVLEFYNDQNSPIQLGVTKLVTGMAVDTKRNLWIANFESGNTLYVKSSGGVWDSFPNINPTASKVLELLIDKSGQKWMRFAGKPNNPGIVVYSDNNTPFDKTDDPAPSGKILSTVGGSGNLPDNTVNCMALDRNGQIWVGTDKGLTVFYSPSNILSANPSDARQIVIGSGDDVGYLLGEERITAILVDGGNRKWIASRSGLWLVSSDGQEVLAHYDESNSPLFSNDITQLGMVESTGELFVATSKGLMSLGTGSSLGGNVHGEVKVYPNPVRPGYSGDITISGLPTDARVKITDIAGNLIYETQANGGTATWNGRSFDGRKASSGVYLIYTANQDASDTFVSKVLIVN